MTSHDDPLGARAKLAAARAPHAEKLIRKARQHTACTCDASRVSWDGRHPYIDHAPGCPLHWEQAEEGAS